MLLIGGSPAIAWTSGLTFAASLYLRCTSTCWAPWVSSSSSLGSPVEAGPLDIPSCGSSRDVSTGQYAEFRSTLYVKCPGSVGSRRNSRVFAEIARGVVVGYPRRGARPGCKPTTCLQIIAYPCVCSPAAGLQRRWQGVRPARPVPCHRHLRVRARTH